MSLWDKRLLIVTGKGGVGRTTVATALALAAAQAGRRAAVAELYGQGRVPALFGLPGRSYTPVAIRPRVDTMSLSPYECLDDFGHRRLKVDALVRAVFRNRVMSAFIDAVPGLHDLLQLGKLDNLLTDPADDDPRYDLLVVDAPATGHGLTMLAAAREMAEMTRVGPFAELARAIERLLADPARTALVVVTLPEDLPVNETLDLVAALGDERDQVGGVVVNQHRDAALPADPPWERVRQALLDTGDGELREVAALGDAVVERQRDQDDALARLGDGLAALLPRPAPTVHLPRIEPLGPGPADIDALAGRLVGPFGGAS